MVARLGFAVATAWKPEILIVDEILSVGDEDFRIKCQAWMENYKSAGTTILLVSHNLDNLLSTCSRALWLDRGAIRIMGKRKL